MDRKIVEQAREAGFKVSEEYFTQISDQSTYWEFRQKLLSSDLRKKPLVDPFFPVDIATVANTSLQGPVVLQLVAFADVTQPSKRQFNDSASRLLSFSVTDGHVKAQIIECEHLSDFHLSELTPGSKILYLGGAVRNGKILGFHDNLKYLGGEVEHLLEAWNANKHAQMLRSLQGNSIETCSDGKVGTVGGGPPKFELAVRKIGLVPKPGGLKSTPDSLLPSGDKKVAARTTSSIPYSAREVTDGTGSIFASTPTSATPNSTCKSNIHCSPANRSGVPTDRVGSDTGNGGTADHVGSETKRINTVSGCGAAQTNDSHTPQELGRNRPSKPDKVSTVTALHRGTDKFKTKYELPSSSSVSSILPPHHQPSSTTTIATTIATTTSSLSSSSISSSTPSAAPSRSIETKSAVSSSHRIDSSQASRLISQSLGIRPSSSREVAKASVISKTTESAGRSSSSGNGSGNGSDGSGIDGGSCLSESVSTMASKSTIPRDRGEAVKLETRSHLNGREQSREHPTSRDGNHGSAPADDYPDDPIFGRGSARGGAGEMAGSRRGVRGSGGRDGGQPTRRPPPTEERTGLVTKERARLVTEERAGLVTKERAGLGTEERAGLVTEERAGLVTEERAGLVTKERAGLVTEERAGLVSGARLQSSESQLRDADFPPPPPSNPSSHSLSTSSTTSSSQLNRGSVSYSTGSAGIGGSSSNSSTDRGVSRAGGGRSGQGGDRTRGKGRFRSDRVGAIDCDAAVGDGVANTNADAVLQEYPSLPTNNRSDTATSTTHISALAAPATSATNTVIASATATTCASNASHSSIRDTITPLGELSLADKLKGVSLSRNTAMVTATTTSKTSTSTATVSSPATSTISTSNSSSNNSSTTPSSRISSSVQWGPKSAGNAIAAGQSTRAAYDGPGPSSATALSYTSALQASSTSESSAGSPSSSSASGLSLADLIDISAAKCKYGKQQQRGKGSQYQQRQQGGASHVVGSGSSGVGYAGAGEGKEWACKSCTFANHASLALCEMCEAAR